MTARNLILTLVLCGLAGGCDSPALPTAPTVPAAPAPTATPPSPNPLAPDWTGTFVSSNWSFSPFPIQARLERTGNVVKGSWIEVQWLDFGGTVEGTIHDTAFIGSITINNCKTEVHGSFTDTTASWTSPAVNDGCSDYNLPSPVDIRFQLSR